MYAFKGIVRKQTTVTVIRSRRGRVSIVRWYLSDCDDKEGSVMNQKTSLEASNRHSRFFFAGEEEISLFTFTWYVFLSHLRPGC